MREAEILIAAGPSSFARQVGIDAREIKRRLDYEGFDADDVFRIKSLSGVVYNNAEALVSGFFNRLTAMEGAEALVNNPSLLARARALKLDHLKAMVRGEYGESYVEQRLQMGLLYFHAGLDTTAFLGAFHNMIRDIGIYAMEDAGRQTPRIFDAFLSLIKIAFFDISLITDALVFERERTIRLQQEAIRGLSTPILQLAEGLLILPLIGVVDTARASQIMSELLGAVRRNRTRAVVIDITGVPNVDANVANHIAQAVRTTGLMGARAVLTGLSGEMARSLVERGVNLAQFETYSTLQDGVEAVQRDFQSRIMKT